MSDYALQIVNKASGQVVQSWEPGSVVEVDLIDELCKRVSTKAGLVSTKAAVCEHVQDALRELLWDLKSRV